MKTSAYIQVGTKEDKKAMLIKAGDVLQLVTGEKVTFVEMKRTKFHGKLNGKTIIVPVYRDRSGSTPFVTAVVGKDTSVIVKKTPITGFKVTDLFSLEGSKETFMFLGTSVKRGGKKVVQAMDVASGRQWNIAADMAMIKINLTKVKADAKEKALQYE